MSFRHAFAITALCLFLTSIGFCQSATTAPTTTATTAPSTKSYPVAGHGDLKLTIPSGWNESEEPVQPGMPRTVRMTDADGKFELLISILPPPKGVADFNSPAKLRAIAEAQGRHLLATSKETSVALQEIKGASAGGFVYTLTDKSPAPRSFEYITGGVVGVGDLILSMTMLMREKNPPERAIALEMLAAASQAPAPQTVPSTAGSTGAVTTTQEASNQTFAVSLPGRKWQIVVDRAGLKTLEDETSPDNRARRVGLVDPTNGVSISIFLEPAATIGDARTARRFFFDRLKRSPLVIREEKFIEDGDAARVDYLLPDANQRHANVYFSKEAVWVDVHISVEDLKGDKQAVIDEIAKSVKLETTPR